MEFNFNDYKSYLNPLSEEFIERNKDRVDWEYISGYQKLSEEFIERNDFNEEDKIVIEVKGGLVTNIFSNFGLHFQVIVNDYDCVDCVRVDTKGLEKIW